MFEDEDPKTVPRSLIEEGSVRGRSLQSSSSTGSTRNQNQFVVFVFVETDRPGFLVNISVQITGNEVFFNFVSKIRHHWKTRLIGIITDQVQVQVKVQVFGITK